MRARSYRLESARFLFRLGAEMFRLAEGPRDAMSVARFLLIEGYCRFAKRGRAARETSVRVHGIEHWVALATGEVRSIHEIYYDRVYDRAEGFEAARGWTVLDLGANVGVFSGQQARRGARVFAFEPGPSTFKRLARMAACNQFDGGSVTVFNRALGAAAGTAWLGLHPSWTIQNRILDTGAIAEAETVEVQVTTLDRVFGELNLDRVHLVKLDVEGSELAVLQGGRQALARVERLVMEYHSHELLRGCTEILAEHGLERVLLVDEPFPGGGSTGVGTAFFSRRGARAAGCHVPALLDS